MCTLLVDNFVLESFVADGRFLVFGVINEKGQFCPVNPGARAKPTYLGHKVTFRRPVLVTFLVLIK